MIHITKRKSNMNGWVELLWHKKRERDFTKEKVELERLKK